ncbi:MAG: hypothetical protein IJR96_06090 [Pseudobutyrivibrio sp.]|nr:hypothetical protein [Pseudobutyrivibrio sp.]
MKIDGWKYYSHAAITTCAPHEKPNLMPIQDRSIWKIENAKPILARWTENFDCGYETNWWYTILDKPFDISKINSHDRNRIKKGLKNFTCKRINAGEYAEAMANVTMADWATYPVSYRPNTTKEQLIKQYQEWNLITYGAFDENEMLCAFHGIADCSSYFLMVQGKSIPEKQRGQVNAALIYTFINDLSAEIDNGKYISNGQRNLYHKTNFNDDLCRYYGFRKVYCRLRIIYPTYVKLMVNVLYPFRKMFNLLDNKALVHQINVVLKMEEIARTFK